MPDLRQGYVQQLHQESLADWAAENNTTMRLLVRPGGYVFPGAAIAIMTTLVDGADVAIRNATVLGTQLVSSADLDGRHSDLRSN